MAYWLLLSPKRSDGGPFSGTAIIALAMFPVLLGTAFFVGMLYGERREGDRRDRQEQDGMYEGPDTD